MTKPLAFSVKIWYRRIHFPDNLPVIHEDAGELQQVFFNIINDAIHAMAQVRRGALTIRTGAENEGLEIR
jgi:nitrogen-specific signal transduction histidine kinase